MLRRGRGERGLDRFTRGKRNSTKKSHMSGAELHHGKKALKKPKK